MATLNLYMPTANEQVNLPIAEDSTVISLEFNLDSAIIERVEDDFVIAFDDNGSSIVLEDFYTTYSADFMPEFTLNNETISGEDFFAALDSSLMPAAGPAATTVADGARFYDLDTASLAGGVDALAGVDGGSGYDRQSFLVEGVGGDTGIIIPTVLEPLVGVGVISINLAILIDSSGSMKKPSLDAIEDALVKLGINLETMTDANGDTVNLEICLIDYNEGVRIVTNDVSVLFDEEQLENLWAEGSNGEGGTNIDAALSAATGWFNSLGDTSGEQNVTILMTDGQPTYAMRDEVVMKELGDDPSLETQVTPSLYWNNRTFTYDETSKQYIDSNGSVLAQNGDTWTINGEKIDTVFHYVVDAPLESITYNGATYTLVSSEMFLPGNNPNNAYDYRHTYQDADGNILTRLDDNGTSGRGTLWYDGGDESTGSKVNTAYYPILPAPQETLTIDGVTYTYVGSESFQASSGMAADYKHTYVGSDGTHLICFEDNGTSGSGTSWSIVVDVNGKPVNPENVSGDGETWTVNGVVYRLVEGGYKEDTNIIELPTLQIQEANGTWKDIGQVELYDKVEGGDYGSSEEMLETEEAIKDLLEAMGSDSLYGIEFNGNGTLETLLNSENIFEAGTDDLSDAFRIALGNTLKDAIDSKTMVGLDGNDTISGTDQADILYSGDGDDTIFGFAGDDFIYGGLGDDTLDGGDGDDIIFGGAGDDILFGGLGDDILSGGLGADTFVYDMSEFTDATNDTILDFNAAEGDMLDLTGYTSNGYTISVNNDGTNGVVTITNDATSETETITLQGIQFNNDDIADASSIAFIKV